MARRNRDYRAEYQARLARAKAQGFSSPKAATRARNEARKLGVSNVSKLSGETIRNITRYASEARRVSAKLPASSPMQFREDKASDPRYLNTYHRLVQMQQHGRVSNSERNEILRQFYEQQYDMEIDDFDEFMADGGSVPE